MFCRNAPLRKGPGVAVFSTHGGSTGIEPASSPSQGGCSPLHHDPHDTIGHRRGGQGSGAIALSREAFAGSAAKSVDAMISRPLARPLDRPRRRAGTACPGLAAHRLQQLLHPANCSRPGICSAGTPARRSGRPCRPCCCFGRRSRWCSSRPTMSRCSSRSMSAPAGRTGSGRPSASRSISVSSPGLFLWPWSPRWPVPIVDLAGHTAALQADEATYLRCLAFAAPPMLLTAAASSFFTGRGRQPDGARHQRRRVHGERCCCASP